MMSSNKIPHLVLDTGAFIKGSHLQDIAENFYSLREVIDEIKDKSTRERLSCLPFEINFLEPSTEDISFIINFSKKTGNYSSLSPVDIKVLALTSFLQRQHVNDDHFKAEPKQGRVVSHSTGGGGGPLLGFTKPKETDPDDDEAWITPNNIAKVTEKLTKIGVKEEEATECPTVACMTVDFAMQNVLLQAGMKVVSADNSRVLRRTSQFVLRCFACFKITEDMTKKFCPSCGNMNTLKRVAVTINEKGEKEIHINFKKPINIRGTKYSLLMPRGGQHSTDPIVVEDQPVPHNKACKAALTEKKLVSSTVLDDPGYVLRSNPFANNDIYSRASRLHILPGRGSSGTSRNPNAVKGRKKK